MAEVPTPTADFFNHVRDTLNRLGPNAWRFLAIYVHKACDVELTNAGHSLHISIHAGAYSAVCEDRETGDWITKLLNGWSRDDSGELQPPSTASTGQMVQP